MSFFQCIGMAWRMRVRLAEQLLSFISITQEDAPYKKKLEVVIFNVL